MAEKHAEELEKLKEDSAARIAQIHLEHAQDDWCQDAHTRPRLESASSHPVVFDMNVDVGTTRQLSSSNVLVDAASRLLQRITGTHTEHIAVSSGTIAVFSCLSGSGIGSAGL